MQLGRPSSPPELTDLVRALNEAGGEALMASLVIPSAPTAPRDRVSAAENGQTTLYRISSISSQTKKSFISNTPGGTDTYPQTHCAYGGV
jgi:hypothetical protein